MRDRLIELLEKGQPPFNPLNDVCIGKLADYLLANGVIVPPCKVGDVVYYINARFEKQGRKKVRVEFVEKGMVDNMTIGDKGVPQIEICNDENEWTMFDSADDFSKTVFLTREEAEQALKGGVQE